MCRHDVLPQRMDGSCTMQSLRHGLCSLSHDTSSCVSRPDCDEEISPATYCPLAAPLTRPAMVWARMASANPPSAIYRLLLACTRWFSFWLAVMYKSAAQAKKKVAIARAKTVRSLYRLVKKPAMLPSTMSAFQVAFTRFVNCVGCSSAVANRVLICMMSLSFLLAGVYSDGDS